MRTRVNILSSLLILTLLSCEKDELPPEIHDPNSVEIQIPEGFPDMPIPNENPLTEEGIALGRRLFYDPILSRDNKQSCASCHAQAFGFSDHNRQFSLGVDEIEGNRNAQTIINVGWQQRLFWDGRARSVEDQAFGPVVNPVEMHERWDNVAHKLLSHPEYPDLFYAAFGTRDIDSVWVVRAIAQFERTLISSNSKYDRYLKGEATLTEMEEAGRILFFTERGDCFHCHGTVLFTDNLFHNNGLDSAFDDPGLAHVTGSNLDEGKFKSPTLRNIAFTAPYMHDGRFATLEEVVDFYSEGLKWSPTIDPLMKNVNHGGVRITPREKEALVAFLHTLSDSTFINNPDFSSPF